VKTPAACSPRPKKPAPRGNKLKSIHELHESRRNNNNYFNAYGVQYLPKKQRGRFAAAPRPSVVYVAASRRRTIRIFESVKKMKNRVKLLSETIFDFYGFATFSVQHKMKFAGGPAQASGRGMNGVLG
jgi:hypothetical protein